MSGAASQPRRLGLLALLAASGEQGMTRDRLIGMLWAETDEERARKGLNQALYALRQEMGADEVFLGTRDVRLNPDLVTSDVAAFTAALKAGQLERATTEYCGPFLEGFHLSEAGEFERWLEEERAGLARDHATALERLARRAAERGDRLDCAEWWRRLAAQDPLNARVAIGLMEALVAAGDRTAALQHARVYEVLLEQELEAPPDQAVVALAERIRTQMVNTAAEPQAIAESPPADLHADTPPPASPADTPPLDLPADTWSPPPVEAEAPPASVPAALVPAAPAPRPPKPHLASPRSARRWVLAGFAAIVLAGGAALLRPGPPRELHAGRISRVTGQPGLELHPALSPDGKFVAYAAGPSGRLRIYVRQVAGGRTIAVADSTPGDQHWPRWSPDGSRLSFEAGHAIYVVPALGGPARLLVAPPELSPGVNGEGAISDDGPGYLAWSSDGRKIAYVVDGRRIEVRATEGGPPTTIAEVDQAHSVAWSPDGSRIAYVVGNEAFVYAPNAIGNIAPSAIWTVAASGGRPEPLTDAASLNTSPVWLPDGRSLLFISDRDGSRDVYRVGIDRSGKPAGAPVRLTTGLELHTIDLSRDGRQLAYADFTAYANVATLPIPAAGPVSAAAAEPLTSGHQSIEGMAVSPDGRWLAFDSDRGGHQAIYLMPRAGGEPEQLSPADSGDDFMPSWSPDGRELAYYGFRGGRRRLFVIPAIGGRPSPVVSDSSNQRFPDWSPDGRRLVYYSDRTGRFELYIVERAAAGGWNTPRQLTTDGGQDARWSPDGRAIAYVRNGGLWAIAPDGGAPRLLVDSRDPAIRPVPLLGQWAPDGRTLYYKALDAEGRASLWSVPVEGGEPRLLVRFDDAARPSPRAEFAVDGRRFYFTLSDRESDIWRMTLERPS